MNWSIRDYEDAGFDKYMRFKREGDIARENIATPDMRDLDVINQRVPQIFHDGETEIKNSDTSSTYTHGLGYVPAFIAFAKHIDSPGFPILSDGWNVLPINYTIDVVTTENTIVFSRSFSGGDFDVKVRFLLFRETAI